MPPPAPRQLRCKALMRLHQQRATRRRTSAANVAKRARKTNATGSANAPEKRPSRRLSAPGAPAGSRDSSTGDVDLIHQKLCTIFPPGVFFGKLHAANGYGCLF